MADEQQASAGQGEQAPQFSIQRIYLKDMSLELPNAFGNSSDISLR